MIKATSSAAPCAHHHLPLGDGEKRRDWQLSGLWSISSAVSSGGGGVLRCAEEVALVGWEHRRRRRRRGWRGGGD